MAVARCCWRRVQQALNTQISHQNHRPAVDSARFCNLQAVSTLHGRSYGSYRNTKFVDEVNNPVDYEVFKSPPEWKYVENVLPLKTVPKPVPRNEYPSGWKPMNPESTNNELFVARTKNHMLPVYLVLTYRGMRRVTRIRYIKGDIWKLNEELKAHLKEKHRCHILSKVHELCGHIEIKGDYVVDVKNFLQDKGF